MINIWCHQLLHLFDIVLLFAMQTIVNFAPGYNARSRMVSPAHVETDDAIDVLCDAFKFWKWRLVKYSWFCSLTCPAITSNTAGLGVEKEDRRMIWLADAEDCGRRGSIETSKENKILSHALTVFRTKKSIWLKAAQLEKSHGTRESLDALLRQALTYIPNPEVLWLMGAKEKWLAGNVPAGCLLRFGYNHVSLYSFNDFSSMVLKGEKGEPPRGGKAVRRAFFASEA